ncbi:MAG: sigma factor-like helix-turn-helix DNA-binding protein [Candidatus Hodgkinia cicadicola]
MKTFTEINSKHHQFPLISPSILRSIVSMTNDQLTQRLVKLQNKARALRLIATCACLRLPLVRNMLLSFVEELWTRAISISELVPIHSISDGRLWIGETCSAQANIYSREWLYFNLFTRKTSGQVFDKLWSCKCRTCTLLSILLKSLLLKNNRKLAWVQMSVIMRFGFQNKFLQFVSLFAIVSAKNFKALNLRSFKAKQNWFHLKRALSALEALRQTKVEIVELSQWLVKKLIPSNIKSKAPREALLLAGKRGLIKAVNRFDFDYPVRFTTYARPWIKHELFKLTSPPRYVAITLPSSEAYTFGDISLQSLIDLASGVITFPPKDSIDLQTRETNIREVYYALSSLNLREQQMLMLRCCRPKWTFLAIGNEFKLSKERARQLCNRSIERLKAVRPPFPNVKPSNPTLVLFHIEVNKPFRKFAQRKSQTVSPTSSLSLLRRNCTDGSLSQPFGQPPKVCSMRRDEVTNRSLLTFRICSTAN